jgi:hypothetical protein
MNLGTAALAYAYRVGIAVHPIAPNKAPLSPHGFKDATRDPQQIRDWWRRHPDANIGARCDWFFVVDVDPRNGGDIALKKWLAVHGELPRTWHARTGSGGSHYFFRHDPQLDSIPLGSLKGTGIDIKGGGRGYVLLAPSVSRKGAYQWIARPSEVAMAAAPSWLMRVICRIKAPPVEPSPPVDMKKYSGIDRVERARHFARVLSPAIEGQEGSRATFVVAMKVARGFALTEDEAYAVLATEWNPSCKPPWGSNDLRRQVRRAGELGSMPVGALLERRTA